MSEVMMVVPRRVKVGRRSALNALARSDSEGG